MLIGDCAVSLGPLNVSIQSISQRCKRDLTTRVVAQVFMHGKPGIKSKRYLSREKTNQLRVAASKPHLTHANTKTRP